MSDVDVFDGIADETTSAPVTDAPVESEKSEDAPATTDESLPPVGPDHEAANGEATPTDEPSKPIETVTEIPTGAVSVTDFAQFVTTELMRAAFESGAGLQGNEFTVPQAIYQTVKASRDQIPHVLVKGPEDKEARVYILKDEAFVWWMARREKLKDRGVGGSTRASNRTAEENLALLEGAVVKALYSQSRLDMWTERTAQATKLVEKYKGFLTDQEVAEETVTLAIQTATDEFNAEQKIKADEKEKAAKAKKSGTAESDNANENTDNE